MYTDFSIVCTLSKTYYPHNFHLFLRCGLPSYDLFCDKSQLKSFLIICPSHELSEIKDLPSLFPTLPIKLVSSIKRTKECLTNLKIMELAISSIIDTELYIVVDPTLILID